MFFRRVFNHKRDTYPSPPSQSVDQINGNVSDNTSEASSEVRISSSVDKVRNHRNYADDRVNNNRVFNVIQLTPLWEHVIRTGHLPDGLNVTELFDEFTERLNDPEWQVRQHALRVLVDVLIILGPKADSYFSPLVAPLVDNLGHAAPAVRKGALDALRVYIGESGLPENVLYDVIDLGMNGVSDSLYGGRLTVGVMLSLPALIQVTLTHPKRKILVRAAINALLTKIGEISYQEIALKILLRIKDLLNPTEFYDCIPINSQHDFNVLCDVYGLKKCAADRSSLNSHRDSGIGLSLPSSSESSQSWTKTSDVAINKILQGSNRPATVCALSEMKEKRDGEQDNEIRWKISKSSGGQNCSRSGTPNSQRNDSCSSSLIDSNCPLTHVPVDELPPGKVIMETDIQLNEDTAVTMRILEADSSNDQEIMASETSEEDEETIMPPIRSSPLVTTTNSTDSTGDSMKTSQATSYDGFDENVEPNRRSTPKRVHFGGEVIKIRTPDSESVAQSDVDDHIRPITHPTLQSPLRAAKQQREDGRDASSSSTASLSIEIPQDNTKPLLVPRERPKTASASSPSISRHSPMGFSFSAAPSPGSHRTKSASPHHPRRLSLGSRLDAIVSPQGPHTPMEMLYNLQRSPLVSPVKMAVTTSGDGEERMNAEESVKSRSGGGVMSGSGMRQESVQPDEQVKSSWEDLDIVSRDIAKGLKSGDWTVRSSAFGQLEKSLMNTDNFSAVQPCLDSLLRTLLSSEKHCEVSDDKKRILINIISRLPLETVESRTNQILVGLCRQGGPNSNQIARALMQRMPAAAVVSRLLSEDFLHARSSRFRENALQIVLYALMTFPSTYFDVTSCVARTVQTAMDKKKRIRQAALDVLAVLGQISSPKVVIEVAKKVTANRLDGDKLCAAIKARLSRKQLPMIRNDDSVQYGLRLPGSHNFSVFGADVEWITNGIGSVSPKSLKARGFNPPFHGSSSTTTTESELDSPSGNGAKSSIPSLMTGQLKFGKSFVQDTDKSFHSSFPNLNGYRGGGVSGIASVGFNSRDSGTFASRDNKRSRFVAVDDFDGDDSDANQKKEMLAVSAIPLHLRSTASTSATSATTTTGGHREETWGQRQAKGQSFPELNNDEVAERHSSKLKCRDENGGNSTPPSSSRTDKSNISRLCSMENQSFGERICGDQGYEEFDGEEHEEDEEEEEEKAALEFLSSRQDERGAQENLGKQISLRESTPVAIPLKSFEQSAQTNDRFSRADDYERTPKRILVGNKSADFRRSSAEDEAKEKVSTPMAAAIKSAFSYKTSLHNRILSKEIQESNSSYDDVAFGILNETRKGEENQEVTSELSTTSTAGSSRSSQQQQPTGQTSSATSIVRRLESLQDYDEAKVKALSRTLSVQTLPSIDSNVEPRPKTSISLNANIPFDDIPIKTRYSSTLSLAQTSRNLDEVDHQLVLEKSFSTFDLKSPRIHSDGGDLLEMKPMRSNAASRPLQRNATEFIKSPKNYLKRGNRKIFPTKIPTSNISPVKVNKVNSNNKYKEYPRSPVMGHFDRPKEAYSNCIAQLDDSNWETVMIGLKNFLRMIRHHPEYIDPHIHVIAGIMAKHVRNLRSQVSRAACQATDEFFYTHHKLLETEADDLVTTLLSRTADTNRFLRKDATKALESMCDNLPTQKVIQLLSTRGMSHQNALVRTTTSYLLCRSVVNLGADKVYSLNKDSRDRIFITGAQLLTEGSLETRNYAKQMFRLLSSHIKYQKVLLEVIPNKLYRNIEKTLKKV